MSKVYSFFRILLKSYELMTTDSEDGSVIKIVGVMSNAPTFQNWSQTGLNLTDISFECFFSEELCYFHKFHTMNTDHGQSLCLCKIWMPDLVYGSRVY